MIFACRTCVHYTISMTVPSFPDFTPITIGLKNEILPVLSLASCGISEFTFSGLYLFRKRYGYTVSRLEDKTIIISGIQPPRAPEEEAGEPLLSKKFFMTPCAAPEKAIMEELFKTHDYWKNIPESIIRAKKDLLEEMNIEITEDRDNFDYLYLRTDLAELPGKKYHKKRNLVAQFLRSYTHEERTLTAELIPQAMRVLEDWRANKGDDGDYIACREALELFNELDMKGLLFYADGRPVGWCLGEPIAGNSIFIVHFEKGLDGYKGIYQYINRTFAASLPENFTHINREQDLGEEGMRQAKMTYRPSGFVRKYIGFYKRLAQMTNMGKLQTSAF